MKQTMKKLLDDALAADAAEATERAKLIILPNVMPKLIAADICGVQPMTGPVGQMFSMSVRFQVTLKDRLNARGRAYDRYLARVTGGVIVTAILFALPILLGLATR